MIDNHSTVVKAPYICIMANTVQEQEKIISANYGRYIKKSCILKPIYSKEILEILEASGLY